MKKITLFAMLIATLLIAGCTQYRIMPDGLFPEFPNTQDTVKYTVTLVFGDGTTDTGRAREGRSFELPLDSSKVSGKKFAGWKDPDGNLYQAGAEIEITDDITFTSHWVNETTSSTIGTTEYNTVESALEAVIQKGEAATIEIVDDVDDGTGLFIASSAALSEGVTINMNGSTYNAISAVGSTGTENQLSHFERGNTVVLKDGTLESSTPSIWMLIQNYSDLTLDNMTLIGNNHISYLLSNNNGTIILKNGTRFVWPEGVRKGVDFDLYYWPGNTYGNVCVIIETPDVVLGSKIEIGPDSTEQGKKFADYLDLIVPDGYQDYVEGFITLSSNVPAGTRIDWQPCTKAGYTDGYVELVFIEPAP